MNTEETSRRLPKPPGYELRRTEFLISRRGGGQADQNWQFQFLRPILYKPARICIIFNTHEIGEVVALYRPTEPSCLALIKRVLENDTSLPWLRWKKWPTGVSWQFRNKAAGRFDSLADIPILPGDRPRGRKGCCESCGHQPVECQCQGAA